MSNSNHFNDLFSEKIHRQWFSNSDTLGVRWVLSEDRLASYKTIRTHRDYGKLEGTAHPKEAVSA